ncbi:hypothetical protein ACP70R_003267 [Stipagrostis hirtigluma subsp. patula]
MAASGACGWPLRLRFQFRTVLLSTLPVFSGGKTPTLPRRRPPLVHPAGRAALSTVPSSSAPAAAAALDLPWQTPAAAAASQGPVTTTASRCTPEAVRGRHFFEVAGYSLHKGLGAGKFIRSAVFSVGGYDWCIRCCPDGDFGEDNGDYISVFLVLMTKDAEVRALYDFRLVNLVNGMSPWACCSAPPASVFSDVSPSWGHPKFKKRSSLESSLYLRDDRLVIQCDVTVITGTQVSQSDTMCAIQVPPSNLADNLAKLLEVKKRADVTFKVKEEVFQAHKIVLAMRSPVFEEEIYSSIWENNKGCITIKDMQPAVFKALLHFIYTDSLPPMDDVEGDEKDEMVKQLLVAADRYAMERLKLICENMLFKRLNAQSVTTS